VPMLILLQILRLPNWSAFFQINLCNPKICHSDALRLS
jgi:hypothetical protein